MNCLKVYEPFFSAGDIYQSSTILYCFFLIPDIFGDNKKKIESNQIKSNRKPTKKKKKLFFFNLYQYNVSVFKKCFEKKIVNKLPNKIFNQQFF